MSFENWPPGDGGQASRPTPRRSNNPITQNDIGASNINQRTPRSFPTKYSALPGIGQNSPGPADRGALIPYPGPGGVAYNDIGNEDRLRQLETRVQISERSNRALLDEVVRLQSELKNQLRRHEDSMSAEHQTRVQMENSLRASNDLISQLAARLKRTEEKVAEEQAVLSNLVTQAKSVEQAVVGNQQEMLSRRDLQNNRVAELRNQVDEALRGRDTLERTVYNIVDEVRQLKSRVETASLDTTTAVTEVRNRAMRLEEESRVNVDSLRKAGETQSSVEQNTAQLRNQVESRLSELRDVVVELRSKQEHDVAERRQLEQQFTLRVSDMQAGIQEQNRRREEAMHAIETVQREREHAAETERIKLQSKIAEIAEEVSKKILQKEIKLREESQSKFTSLELVLRAEQDQRQKFERDIRDENDQKWDGLRKAITDDMLANRDRLRGDKKKQNEALMKLNDGINLLEKQLEEHKKTTEKLLAAEIHSRKQSEKISAGQVDQVHDKINVATATLQQAIGGLTIQITAQQEKVKRELRTLIDEGGGQNIRHLADLDTRLTALTEKTNGMESNMEAKIQSASQLHVETLNEKVGSISLWQGVTEDKLVAINDKQTEAIEEMKEVQEKLELLKAEISAKLEAEGDVRNADLEAVREELMIRQDTMKPRTPTPKEEYQVTEEMIEKIHQSIRKLAESLQTVKTVLGMKIQSEQRLRVDEVKMLREEQVRLTALVEPLLRKNAQPRLFIKVAGKTRAAAEAVAPEINKWSIYNAYRWLNWKTRLTFPAWKQQTDKQNEDDDKVDDSKDNKSKDDDKPNNSKDKDNKDDGDRKDDKDNGEKDNKDANEKDKKDDDKKDDKKDSDTKSEKGDNK